LISLVTGKCDHVREEKREILLPGPAQSLGTAHLLVPLPVSISGTSPTIGSGVTTSEAVSIELGGCIYRTERTGSLEEVVRT
jgi:hypothetical protein